ncbi:uncharacterized protein ASCRUDRAFT_86226 [Ascoidea rubescens DSM 1968]|uniref:Uncharacterized protein n=1 Tax=Ascoidea rubescens DSM 1968 TaxID=1344418 RepID=A0A1D2VIF7_9ASCO|nr:hypothetical protein ASCRUDRAFT_86226 [Ascoidea rubescens DSM 1968]ODV61257.1 hypothetical protein ASCRUDRAFT_86226 [Ascoidea rubescens DSM 1968]
MVSRLRAITLVSQSHQDLCYLKLVNCFDFMNFFSKYLKKTSQCGCVNWKPNHHQYFNFLKTNSNKNKQFLKKSLELIDLRSNFTENFYKSNQLFFPGLSNPLFNFNELKNIINWVNKKEKIVITFAYDEIKFHGSFNFGLSIWDPINNDPSDSLDINFIVQNNITKEEQINFHYGDTIRVSRDDLKQMLSKMVQLIGKNNILMCSDQIQNKLVGLRKKMGFQFSPEIHFVDIGTLWKLTTTLKQYKEEVTLDTIRKNIGLNLNHSLQNAGDAAVIKMRLLFMLCNPQLRTERLCSFYLTEFDEKKVKG